MCECIIGFNNFENCNYYDDWIETVFYLKNEKIEFDCESLEAIETVRFNFCPNCGKEL